MSQQCRDLVQCHNSSEPVSPRRASGGSSLQLSMVLWCIVFLGYRESCVRISASTHRYVQLSVTETCVVLLQSRSSRLLRLRALSAQVWLQFGFLLTARLVHPLANVLEIQATLVHATTDQLSLHALHDLQDQWDSLLWEHSAMSPLCDCLIFCTRLAMNCLYSPCPRIQYKATELSSQQCVLLTGSPSRASLTLSTRFTAMWPETSSNRGMVSPCLDSLDLAAIRPWLVPDACQMTA